MDEAAVLEVGFAVNIDQLTSASSAIDSVFVDVASAAASGGAKISDSMTAAADSFSSITSAMDELTSMTAAGAEEAASSLSSISEAGTQISAGIEEGAAGATDALSSIPAAADTAAAESESAFSGFDIGGMVTGIGMGIFSLQAIGNIATQTASALLGPAEAAENTQASFTNLLGSSKAAADELSNLNNFAAKTQFKTQDIDNAAASLIAFKTPARDVIPDLTAVGDALTSVGKGTPAEMQGVVNIIGKIGVQGKLTQGDITQLGAHGIDAMSAIEKGGGISAKSLQDMISKGTLPAGKAIDDLTKGIEKNPMYSGGMAKQANTLSGQLSTVSSDMDQVMAAALKPALPELEKVFGQLTTVLTSPSFKAFAVTMGTDIATGVTDVVTGVTDLVTTGTGLVNFFQKNQAAGDALIAVLAGVGAVVLAVVIPAMIAWAIAMGPVALEAIIAAAPFILLGLVVGAVIFGIIMAVQHWGAIMNWISGVAHAVSSGVSGFFGGMGNDIMGVFGKIGGFVEGVFNSVADKVKWFINLNILALDTLINGIDNFHLDIPSITVGGVTIGGGSLSLPYIPPIPMFAQGGVIPAGGYGIAGERGAELIYGGSSGVSVMSASQSAGVLSGGGGEIHVHVHNYIDGKKMTDNIMTNAVKTIRGQGGRMVAI